MASPARSKVHPYCLARGTSERPHRAPGRCTGCYRCRYCREHREERRAYHRRYRTADPAGQRRWVRSWRDRSRERYLEWSRPYQRERHWRQRRQGRGERPIPRTTRRRRR